MKCLFILILLATGIIACGERHLLKEGQIETNFVVLENDFSTISDSTFRLIDNWLIGAEIIGLGEGEHGMNESLNFRNSYIKHLINSNQIQVLAFESGILESKMVNDYIHGKNLDLDSVLANGFSYTFGQFEQSKELLIWLREINSTRSKEKKVRFYGFDMAGNAPNPYLENSAYALDECLNYLHKVDPVNYQYFFSQVEKYIPYLSVLDDPDKYELSFADLSEGERVAYGQILENLKKLIEVNRDQYVSKAGLEEYIWGLQSVTCAQQNLTFLIGFHKPNRDQSSREKFMLNNLQWIRDLEGGNRILLFAHVAHLLKDVSRIDEDGNNTLSDKMFGEHLLAFYGEKYKVIGNLFSELDYYDEVEHVLDKSLPAILFTKYKEPNFCLKVTPTDSMFTKPSSIGVPFKGNLWTTSAVGMDVILYSHKQHYFLYKE